MINFIKKYIPSRMRHVLQFIKSLFDWHGRNYEAPSPSLIKQRVLLRNAVPFAAWVETGTYLGDTTYFLSKHFNRVISIEPEPQLYAEAKRRFVDFKNVELLNGASEIVFPELLPKLIGDLNFWLDGHYSGGKTWATYKGDSESPIMIELAQIEKNLNNFKRLAVLIDDVRSFQASDSDSGYPSLDYLVGWARRLGMKWHIEHDIFVAKLG